MGVTTKELIVSQYAANSLTTQYAASNCKTVIDKFTCRNDGATNQTLSVYLTEEGNLAVGDTLVVARAIAPGETYTFPELVGHVLDDGSFISTNASAASQLSIRASGREITT